MRGTVPGLGSPHPLADTLPALYRSLDGAQHLVSGDQDLIDPAAFLSAFDDALAPVFATIQSLADYLDPLLAPADFVDWLSGWLGLRVDQTWALSRRRRRIVRAVELYRSWGTVEGLANYVAIFFDIEPACIEVVENGAVVASPTPGSRSPGRPGHELTVRVRVPDPSSIAVDRLDDVVAAAKPAHLAHRVEVIAE